MADNPFTITPANPLQALMAGGEGYNLGNKAATEQRLQVGRQSALQALMSGGDLRGALGQLINAGDYHGAQAIATFAHQQAAEKHQAESLAEQIRSNKESARIQEAGINKPQLVTGTPDLGGNTPYFEYNRKPGGGGSFTPLAVPGATPATTQSPVAQAQPTTAIPAQATPTAGQNTQTAQPSTAIATPEAGQRNEAFLATVPEGGRELIKKIANYEINPTTLTTKGGHRERILNAVAAYDPTYDQNFYSTKTRTMGAFSAGVEGRVVRAVGNLTEHLATAEELATALKNGDNQAINALKNRFGKLFGATAPTNAAIAAPIIGGEMTKVVAGVQGGGQTERLENALNVLGQAKTTDQLLQGLQVVRRLMVGQIHGLESQYETGTKLKNFRDRLTPTVRKMLDAEEARNNAPPGTPANSGWSVQEIK